MRVPPSADFIGPAYLNLTSLLQAEEGAFFRESVKFMKKDLVAKSDVSEPGLPDLG